MAKMTREEEAKKIETKYASLKEDYVELQRHMRALKKRAKINKDKKKRLEAEVRFLRRKYQMFTEKDHEEPADPSVFPESGTKALSIYRRSKEPTEVLAIEDEPARDGLIGLQALMSTDHCTSPEMTGLQPSTTRMMPPLTVPQGLLVTPVSATRMMPPLTVPQGLLVTPVSATRMMPPLTVPQGLLVTPVVKPAIKKRQNNGLVSAQKRSKVGPGDW